MKRSLKWYNWLGIALFVGVVFLLLFNAYGYRWELYANAILLPLAQAVICKVVFGWWMRRVRRWYPDVWQTRQRIVLTFTGYVAGIFILELLLIYPIVRSNVLSLSNTSLYVTIHLIVSLFIVLLVGMIYENIYYLDRYRAATAETEAARSATLQSQLDALRQQINPHFLFNSLNSLSSLIEDDPRQASQFVDELSGVYRYLLRANDQALAPLSRELDFIRSYFHLLKTRHGPALSLSVRADERFEKYQLPPLTLQLLVENAVKHNVVLPDQPLTIDIQTNENGLLVVRNNLQRKKRGVLSNGVGLSNILSQYQMLGQPAPVISETDGQFVVTLPLVEPV